MPDYILDPQADEHLREIWRFIAMDNPVAASKVIVAAYKTFELAAHSPKLGKLREVKLAGGGEIRSCPVLGFKKYLVFYQPMPDGIRVLRVYHVKRDLESLFSPN